MTRPRWINALLLVLLVVGSVVVGANLPDRYPVHFGLDGRADRFASRSSGEWYLLTAVAVGMSLLLWAAGHWSERHPRLINLPNKDKLLNLPPERQREALAAVREMMDWLSVLLTIIFMLIQVAIYEFAVGRNGQGWIIGTELVALIATPIATFWLASRVSARIEELARPGPRVPRSGSSTAALRP